MDKVYSHWSKVLQHRAQQTSMWYKAKVYPSQILICLKSASMLGKSMMHEKQQAKSIDQATKYSSADTIKSI